MSIINSAKEIAELVKKYNDQDLYQKLVSLREEIIALREDNIELRERLSQLERNSKISSELKREGNAYYIRRDQEEAQGPYCMACWDYDSKLVNMALSTASLGGRSSTRVICTICSSRSASK